jgi:hypothetical protein
MEVGFGVRGWSGERGLGACDHPLALTFRLLKPHASLICRN